MIETQGASALRRWLRRCWMGALPLVVLYAAVCLHPQLLFANELHASNVVLHARTPLPPQALAIAAAAQQRLSRSPFFEAGDTYDVFLCDTPALFSLFALWDHGVGGVAQVYLKGNVFLRPSRIERDRLIGPSGQEATGDRTLTYFVAHELTHIAVARRLGRLKYHRLARWQQEGYADYVGKGGRDGTVDFDRTLRDYHANLPELDPARSGLYLRYHLLVAYLLDRTGMTPNTLLSTPRDQAAVEGELPDN